MLKKISAILILSIATAINASHLTCNTTGNLNCTGYYYKDINAAFLDCFNEKGHLESRDEEFF